MRSRLSGVLIISAFLLTACDGGGSAAGGSSVTPPTGGTVSGNAASMSVAMTGFAVLGVPASFPLTLTIKDAGGNTLTGALSSPITITSSDTTGVVTVAPATISNATTAVNLVYSGGKVPAAVTIGGTLSGGTLSVTSLSFIPNGDHPVAGGTSASYAQTITTTPIFPAGLPAVSTSSYIETLTSNATFNGMTNLIDDKVVQQTGTGTSASTSANDYYLQLSLTATGSNLLQVGYASNYQSLYGTTIGNYVYSNPALTLDELPHKSGNTWSSLYGYRGQTAFSSNGALDASSGLPDGSYTATNAFSTGTTTTTQNADGSFTAGTISMSTPTTVGGQKVIVYTSGTPAVSVNVPDWYPNGGAATPIQTAKTTDMGSVAIPVTCGLSASIATTAEDLHTDSTHLSPYFVANALGGYSITSTDRYMAPGIGLVCSITTSTTNDYNATTDGSLATTTQTVTVDRMIGGGFGPLVRTANGSFGMPGFMGVRPLELQRATRTL